MMIERRMIALECDVDADARFSRERRQTFIERVIRRTTDKSNFEFSAHLKFFFIPQSEFRNPKSTRPLFAIRKFVTLERFRFHGDAVAGNERRHIMTAPHNHRVYEMLVQVVNEFNATVFKLAAHGYVIED